MTTPAATESWRDWDRFLFAPTNDWAVAAFRLALACMCVWAFWPVGLVRFSYELTPYPFMLELYPTLFSTTPWFALQIFGITLFGLGVAPRIVGPLLVLSLLPGVFEVGTMRSRQILVSAVLCLSMLRSTVGVVPLPRPASRTDRTDRTARSAGPMWPIRLVQIQLSLVYAVNAIAKMTPEYLDGTVLEWLSVSRWNFKVDLAGGYLHLGPLVVPTWLCAVGTVVVESALALGFWFRRTRIATAALGFAFHMSLKLILVIGFLDWASLCLYLSFLLPLDASKAVDVASPSRRGA